MHYLPYESVQDLTPFYDDAVLENDAPTDEEVAYLKAKHVQAEVAALLEEYGDAFAEDAAYLLAAVADDLAYEAPLNTFF